MSHPRPALGLFLVLLGATLFILNAGVSRVALRAGIGPAELTTVRVSGSVVCLVVFAAALRRSALRPPRGRTAVLVLAHGLIGVAALQWTYFVAIDRLAVGLALLLEYQAPILVALWARLVQREPVRPLAWVGLALAVSGLAAATGIGAGLELDAVGVAAGLGAAVCFAAYFLIGEAGVGQLDPVRVILWSFGAAAVVLNLTAPVGGIEAGVLGDQTSMLGRLGGLDAPLWLLLVWIVLLGTLVPFAAMLLALRHLSATAVTTVAMLEPVGAVALGWVWFSESLGPVAVVGCTAVVVGIVLAQLARAGRPVEPIIT